MRFPVLRRSWQHILSEYSFSNAAPRGNMFSLSWAVGRYSGKQREDCIYLSHHLLSHHLLLPLECTPAAVPCEETRSHSCGDASTGTLEGNIYLTYPPQSTRRLLSEIAVDVKIVAASEEKLKVLKVKIGSDPDALLKTVGSPPSLHLAQRLFSSSISRVSPPLPSSPISLALPFLSSSSPARPRILLPNLLCS